MATPIKRVGIISKPKKTEIREIVPALLEWLRERSIEAFIDKETGAIMETKEHCLTRNEMPAQVDLLIVLGGDGTLLATARALNRKPVPILAVNLGGLGFLTEITREELYPTLEMVVAGTHQTDRRVQIEGELIRADEILTSFLALNDVVLNKGAIARIFDFEVAGERRTGFNLQVGRLDRVHAHGVDGLFAGGGRPHRYAFRRSFPGYSHLRAHPHPSAAGASQYRQD